MKPKVFVARPIQQAAIDHVAKHCDVRVHSEDAPMTAAQLADAITDMDGLMSVGGNINEELLAHAPKLRVVANIGAGYDSIDVAACTRRRIVVSNTPDVLTESTADMAFGLLLAVSRHLTRRRPLRSRRLLAIRTLESAMGNGDLRQDIGPLWFRTHWSSHGEARPRFLHANSVPHSPSS